MLPLVQLQCHPLVVPRSLFRPVCVSPRRDMRVRCISPLSLARGARRPKWRKHPLSDTLRYVALNRRRAPAGAMVPAAPRKSASTPMSTPNRPVQTVGPFELEEELGRGGIGVVYRARHRATGQAVALKTVRVPDLPMVASIRREIRALARVDHPGVVRIVADGVAAGIPWYAMEIVAGQRLDEYCRRFWLPRAAVVTAAAPVGSAASRTWVITTEAIEVPAAGLAAAASTPPAGAAPPPARQQPTDLGELLGVIIRVCQTLAYIHGESIVHRDLKPANILVKTDGSPVLLDFGLTVRSVGRSSREVLDAEAFQSVGTISYMSPEQIRGELVDARADLYSLGCILYELLTGKLPYAGSTPREILLGHLSSTPIPPAQLAAGIPSELDHLLLWLLAKEPRKRPGYATDVISALIRCGAFQAGMASAPVPRDYLYRPPFVGRTAAVQTLTGCLAELRRGRGSIVFIGGASGSGKTRLMVELTRLARQMVRALALVGESPMPVSPGAPEHWGCTSPLGALREPLRAIGDRCRQDGAAMTARLLGDHARLLAAYEESLAELPGVSALPSPAELPSDAAVVRLFAALLEAFAALADEQPLLLILDDLHWADDLTLQFLSFLCRGDYIKARPWLLVGTYRTEEAGRDLRLLADHSGVHHLQLEPLSEKEVGVLVREMLGLADEPTQFVDFLHSQCEGNPLFVSEYLRTAISQQLLRRTEGTGWHVVDAENAVGGPLYETLRLPRSLADLINRYLDSLGGPAREVLQAAAVIGRETDADLLVQTAGVAEPTTVEATVELLSRKVLEELQGGQLRFTHSKLREVAYGRIAPSRRQQLHGAAAAALSGRADAAAELAGTVARHYESAAMPELAAPYYVLAAERSLARYANREAGDFARRALDLGAASALDAAHHCRALLCLGAVRERAGDWVAACAAFEEAIGIAESARGKLYRQALLAYARLLTRAGDPARAVALSQRCLLLAEAAADLSLQARAHTLQGIAHGMKGEVAAATAFFEQALALGEASGDRDVISQALDHLADMHLQGGCAAEAEALYERAIAICRECEDHLGEAIRLNNLARLHYLQGAYNKALQLFRAAMAIFKSSGERPSEMAALNNVALLYHVGGRLEEALEMYLQALAFARAIGAGAQIYSTLCNIADVERAKGLLGAAFEHAREALARCRDVGSPQDEAAVLILLGRLHLHAGQLDESEVMLVAASENAARSGSVALEAEARYFRVSLLVILGHLQEARAEVQVVAELAQRSGVAELALAARAAVARLADALPGEDELAALSERASGTWVAGPLAVDVAEALRLRARTAEAVRLLSRLIPGISDRTYRFRLLHLRSMSHLERGSLRLAAADRRSAGDDVAELLAGVPAELRATLAAHPWVREVLGDGQVSPAPPAMPPPASGGR
ncbi:MAG: protein kinase [Candidatus Schekmanbacteria bacterium]|nr:protein kinase [Candidatus Schekmanbacteria bacterium]